jgi:hypothetical protein
MNTALKIVTKLPLEELWRSDGFSTASRIRWLCAEEIAALLHLGRVQFVVAEVGASLTWIPLAGCYEFWKREAQTHLAAPDARVSLDDYPGGYCYLASEWSSRGESPIIVLEKHH